MQDECPLMTFMEISIFPPDRYVSLLDVRISFPSFLHNIHHSFTLLTLYTFQPKK